MFRPVTTFANMVAMAQRTFLFLAWGILFTHSIVPHSHESDTELEVCTTSHEHDNNLLEALSHIFHFSTGEDHLEDFQGGTGTVALVHDDQIMVPLLELFENDPSAFYLQPAENNRSYRYRPLRAPPVYS